MPNNGRITLCPYYRDEKNLSISCEDTFRRFRWPAQKVRWMDDYCDKDWESCPYAQDLNNLYRKIERGDEEMNSVERLRQKNKALEKEQRRLISMLGRSEKREKRKDAEIKELRGKFQRMESYSIKVSRDNSELREQIQGLELYKASMMDAYEGRLAYLMANYSGGVLDEVAMSEWGKKHKYKIIADEIGKDANGKDIGLKWRVIIEEVSENENRKQGSSNNPAEVAE
ncbi:MAG: hypothetical protein Q4C46_05615 [Bacillota bacterium]|nr:hypothetical protein [Bacillota bacterium]